MSSFFEIENNYVQNPNMTLKKLHNDDILDKLKSIGDVEISCQNNRIAEWLSSLANNDLDIPIKHKIALTVFSGTFCILFGLCFRQV